MVPTRAIFCQKKLAPKTNTFSYFVGRNPGLVWLPSTPQHCHRLRSRDHNTRKQPPHQNLQFLPCSRMKNASISIFRILEALSHYIKTVFARGCSGGALTPWDTLAININSCYTIQMRPTVTTYNSPSPSPSSPAPAPGSVGPSLGPDSTAGTGAGVATKASAPVAQAMS